MSKAIVINDGYVALLDAIYLNGLRLGNISEDGVDWGGDPAQKLKLFAAQIRSNPVKTILTRGATNVITGKMIELVPKNCVTLMGGSINEETGGWDAPANSVIIEGNLKILAGTGQTIDVKRVSLTASDMRGGLGSEKVLGINFEIEMNTPLDASSPYSIYPTKPFIEAEPTALTFEKAGGAKAIEIEASGPFSVGKVPDGFTVEIVNGRVTVIASENTGGAQRTGKLSFILQSDTSKTVEVSLTQSA